MATAVAPSLLKRTTWAAFGWGVGHGSVTVQIGCQRSSAREIVVPSVAATLKASAIASMQTRSLGVSNGSASQSRVIPAASGGGKDGREEDVVPADLEGDGGGGSPVCLGVAGGGGATHETRVNAERISSRPCLKRVSKRSTK